MFVDELHLSVAAQQHTEIVEPGHHPLQFHAVDQEDRERRLGLADGVEERVLQVLFFVVHGSPMLKFCSAATKRAA